MNKKVLVILIIVVAVLALIPAILLGVGILGTGMVIQNQGEYVVEDVASNFESMAIKAHNNMFEQYKGEVGARQANACIKTVASINMQGQFTVELENDEIENNKQYNISFEYDKEGYINKVIIKEID